MNNTIAYLRQNQGTWLRFHEPVERTIVLNHTEAEYALRQISATCRSNGCWALMCLSYEAAPVFENWLKVREDPAAFPLLILYYFDQPPQECPALPPARAFDPASLKWEPEISQETYTRGIDQIKEHIASGYTYQVNYTHRLRSRFSAEPYDLFYHLQAGQRAGHAAYLDAGDWVICSASPELYFETERGRLRSRPMKGTAARGRWPGEDREKARALQDSIKERAENLMILDMVRNDLGRIAPYGSVQVRKPFALEKYPTVWQMTSTVEADTEAELYDILRASFPPSSITGAPKGSTMQIIADLESSPRRAYTGSIGWVAPDGRTRFNVAIRTAIINRSASEAEYGVGGGVVQDSTALNEWQECRAKAQILLEQHEPFSLLETMRWTPEEGIYLQNRHLDRLEASAEYFDFRMDRRAIESALKRLNSHTPEPQKARLILEHTGDFDIEVSHLPAKREQPVRLGISRNAVTSSDRFLFHKTTRRAVYELAQSAHPEADDVVLLNQRGEVCESTIANIAVRKNGALLTPRLDCGLLPGILRAELLDNGELTEAVLYEEDLQEADEILLISALRGVRKAVLF